MKDDEEVERSVEYDDTPQVDGEEQEDEDGDAEPVEDDGEPPLLIVAGLTSTELLLDPKEWINRRVETVEILSREETRRRVSIDFTLSDEHLRGLTTDHGVVVPISVLTKEPRRNFDLRDESGRSVPAMGKNQNGFLAHTALLNAVFDALPEDATAEVFEMIAADLRQVVFAQEPEAREALAFFIGSANSGDRWRAAVWEDATCQSLLNVLVANYVLYAVLTPETASRRVLKYSYGDDFDLGLLEGPIRERLAPAELLYRAVWPDREQILIECPMAWRAASFHAEIAIPEELRFEVAVLFDRDGGEQLSAFDWNVNRAALYASSDLHPEQSPAVLVEVAAERQGRPMQAAVASVIVAALLWLGVISDLDAENPGAAVSILLAGAALFSGLVAAQGENRLVQTVFSASRRWLLLVAVAALAGSASLAMEIPSAQPVCVWVISAALGTLAALRLGWTAIRAPR